jgi:hypothetical protein
MKYLDTLEVCNKVIKLTRGENYFTLWIHDKHKDNIETIQLSEKELKGFVGFINRFLEHN